MKKYNKYKLFEYLSFEPKRYAHTTGQHLATIAKTKPKSKFTKEINLAFDQLLDLCPSDLDVIRVTKVWLSEYNLPMDATKLNSFNRFNERCNLLVTVSTWEGTLNDLVKFSE
jgi:hypothetical protein